MVPVLTVVSDHFVPVILCPLQVAVGIFATGSNDSLVLMYYIDVGRSALHSPQPMRLVAASKVMCLKINSNMILVGLDDGKMQVFKMTVQNSQHTHTHTHTYMHSPGRI